MSPVSTELVCMLGIDTIAGQISFFPGPDFHGLGQASILSNSTVAAGRSQVGMPDKFVTGLNALPKPDPDRFTTQPSILRCGKAWARVLPRGSMRRAQSLSSTSRTNSLNYCHIRPTIPTGPRSPMRSTFTRWTCGPNAPRAWSCRVSFTSPELIADTDFLRTEVYQDYCREMDIFQVVGSVFKSSERSPGRTGSAPTASRGGLYRDRQAPPWRAPSASQACPAGAAAPLGRRHRAQRCTGCAGTDGHGNARCRARRIYPLFKPRGGEDPP